MADVAPLTTPPVAGYAAWYDASQITSPPANGGALANWNDLSGNGLTLAQATGAKQPVYYSTTTANLLNGLPTVVFNGTGSSGQGMQTAGNVASANPVSVFLVAKTANPGNGGFNQRPLVIPSTIQFNWDTTPTYYMFGPSAAISGGTVNTSWHILTGLLTATTGTMRLDSVQIATGAIGAAVTPNPITLGALAGVTSQYLNGAVAELIVYCGVTLTGAQVTSIESYLQNKWLAPPTITSTACAVTIGPLTTTVASGSVTVGGCGRGAWLTLGSMSVNLEDASRGYFCSQLDLGWPTPRAVVANRPDADGEIDRTQYMGARIVSANITAVNGAGPGIDAVASMFAPFMAPSARPVLHYVLNRPGAGERTLIVRGTGYTWPIAGPADRNIQLQWEAADPIARDPTVRTATATVAAAASITSAGDVPVRPLLRVTGPITAPAVTIAAAGAPPWTIAFQSSFTIAAGHFVDIDTQARTVYLDANPAQPRLSSIDWTQSSWQWIPPAPVTATLALAGTATTGATQVTATFQDGYLT